jgi:nitrite reductase (NADH) small subunit
MAFVKVGSLSSLPPGSVTEARLGEAAYAICNVEGELHALDGICPHAGGPLGEGNVQGNMVICPWHEWAYDCRTGENDYDPAVKLDCFQVKAEGDDILMDPEARV